MKKIYIILFLIAISILCTVFLIRKNFQSVRNDYYRLLEKTQSFDQRGFTESILEQHWEKDTAYPLHFTPEAILHLSTDYPELGKDEISAIEDKMFIDVFSKNKEYLLYVPIENEGFICGYLLLSSGVDGKINNKDFIKFKSMNEAIENLNLYSDLEFSYFDYLWGTKDLLLLKMDHCNR